MCKEWECGIFTWNNKHSRALIGEQIQMYDVLAVELSAAQCSPQPPVYPVIKSELRIYCLHFSDKFIFFIFPSQIHAALKFQDR